MTAVLDHVKEPTEKRRTARACLNCQKAHLTCDNARPCCRCIKRDLASNCTDTTRKKAKYLQDSPTDSTEDTSISLDGTIDTTSLLDMTNTSQLFNFSLADLGFGSATAGLEYGILGNMLEDPLLNFSTTEATTLPLHIGLSSSMHHQTSPFLPRLSVTPSTPLKPSNLPAKTTNRQVNRSEQGSCLDVKKPFNYAEGFHYLIRYVKDRMTRHDLMRISKALALFRPSFLTLIMNLTEEDLVFMEKCLQRTLLEYEKLINFSGTPTVVWRRTGEICLVGKEFSLLTQWKRETILKNKKYIYELMDCQSAIEYWEKFSIHAFDNTNKSCIYSCIIKTPDGKLVPCTFCFTIKRDIFDLPSVIVGNFLPILS